RNQAAVSNVVCKDCGFVFQNPRLTSQETLHLYRETDYMQRNYHAGIKQIHDAMTPLEEDRLNYLTPFVPNWPRVSLLELGPGARSEERRVGKECRGGWGPGRFRKEQRRNAGQRCSRSI